MGQDFFGHKVDLQNSGIICRTPSNDHNSQNYAGVYPKLIYGSIFQKDNFPPGLIEIRPTMTFFTLIFTSFTKIPCYLIIIRIIPIDGGKIYKNKAGFSPSYLYQKII